MKILHVNFSDNKGGASISVMRLHKHLLSIGVDSSMLVSQKRSVDPRVFAVASTLLGRFLVKVNEFLEARVARYVARDESVFLSLARYSQFKNSTLKQITKADVVALYWVNGAFMSPEDIKRIKQPLIWRLSDVWPFTGGCHYDQDCGLYRSKCGNCKILKSSIEKSQKGIKNNY